MYNHINFFYLNKLGQNKNQLEKTNIEKERKSTKDGFFVQ